MSDGDLKVWYIVHQVRIGHDGAHLDVFHDKEEAIALCDKLRATGEWFATIEVGGRVEGYNLP